MSVKKQIHTTVISALALGILAAVLWNSQSKDDSPNSIGEMDSSFVTAGPFYVSVTMEPNPPKVGKNKIRVVVRDENKVILSELSDVKIRAVAEMPAMGSMPAMRAAAEFEQTAPGIFIGEMEIPMSGEWPLAVDIEADAIGHSDLTFEMATGRKDLKLATATPGDVAHYTCSMHPSVKNAIPGICPICGMDLVPVTNSELTAGTITVDARRRQLIGVTTGIVKTQQINKIINAVGRITYDETRLQDISLKYDAWIGDLYSNYVGVSVTKGEPLFTVYSPELLAAQEEYLETIKRMKSRGMKKSRFSAAAQRKLRLWGLSEQQIDNLARKGKSIEQLPVLATVDGTVIEKHAVAGSAIKLGQTILRVADLSKVWAEAQLYDHELPEIKIGMPATVILPDLQNREFKGTVSYIYPFMEDDTRTVRVRVILDNADGFLRPDMYVHIALSPDLGKRLVIPESAVLYAGHTRVAFVDLGEGRLQPRRIKTGVRNRDFIEVLDGLIEGDRIVTSGNFLIAAEAKLKTGVDQW